jgi:uncharacterized protein (TIGR03086 family)
MASETTSGGQTAGLPDWRSLHERASKRFVELVGKVPPDRWTASTPCSEWDMRALVDHVVRWESFVPAFITGRRLADIPAAFEQDVLTHDPALAAAAAARAAVAAFDTPGALARIVQHPFGEMPGTQVLYLRLFDNTIHGWDLARALGADFVIESDVAELLYTTSLAQRDALRASGHFGPAEVAVASNADTQTRLLGLLGRTA